jgi:hypothetical protein
VVAARNWKDGRFGLVVVQRWFINKQTFFRAMFVSQSLKHALWASWTHGKLERRTRLTRFIKSCARKAKPHRERRFGFVCMQLKMNWIETTLVDILHRATKTSGSFHRLICADQP